MKKILTTAGVSVLTTLAAVGGVVGVLANAPSTKDKFSVSWSQTDLIGNNQENINKLENTIKEKDNQIFKFYGFIFWKRSRSKQPKHESETDIDILGFLLYN